MSSCVSSRPLRAVDEDGEDEDRRMVKLRCNDMSTVEVHLAVLKASSNYFAQQVWDRDMVLNVELSRSALRNVLQYAYSSQLNHLQHHELISVLAAARYLRFQELFEKVRNLLVESMPQCLASAQFLLNDAPEDVVELEAIFSDERLQERMGLYRRLQEWKSRAQAKGLEATLDRAFFEKLIDKNILDCFERLQELKKDASG